MPPQQPQYRPQPHQQAPGLQPHVPGPEESYATPPPAPQSPQLAPPPAPQQTQPQHDYSFIMEPAHPFTKPPASLAGLPSVAKVIAGLLAVFALFVVIAILKGALGSGSSAAINKPALLSVVQDQQELIHLSKPNAAEQQGLSTFTANSMATVQLSVDDSQQKLLAYLASGHVKLNGKQFSLKVSKTTDTQLSSALANGIFDATYQTVMKDQLTTYSQDLKSAYSLDSGHTRVILKGDYNGALLLLQQLASPSS